MKREFVLPAPVARRPRSRLRSRADLAERSRSGPDNPVRLPRQQNRKAEAVPERVSANVRASFRSPHVAKRARHTPTENICLFASSWNCMCLQNYSLRVLLWLVAFLSSMLSSHWFVTPVHQVQRGQVGDERLGPKW